jgi:hypothetical protein
MDVPHAGSGDVRDLLQVEIHLALTLHGCAPTTASSLKPMVAASRLLQSAAFQKFNR